jgi:hypothetical protein
MTEPDPPTTDPATRNTAEHGSTVGIQAEHVHNSNVYMVQPDASPSQKYEVGVRYLEDGVPSRARALIHDAIVHGHDNGEVRFHWMLAMLSKRSYRDLTPEEHQGLGRASEILPDYADDEWKRALEAICELLDYLNDSGGDSKLALEKLRALQTRQRDEIVRHLDLFLTGSMKDNLWAETHQAAKAAQLSEDRLDRVWAYFHPEPSRPRVKHPAEDSTTPGNRFHALSCSGLFVIAVGYLGRSVLVHATPLPIVAYLLALAAGYVGVSNGLEWRYRTERLRVKDRGYSGGQLINQAPEGGFASQVDHSFARYFGLYVPKDANREVWLAETAGIRNTLRNELVELYREKRTGVDRINWLIRYLVRDVRKRWEEDTLLEYRKQYQTEPSTKVWCSLSLAVLVPSAVNVIVAAIQTDPLPAAIATIVALASGRVATMRWLRITSERRRLVEDGREYERLSEERQTAYQRWKDKLNSTRPFEGEMETWLNCDKKMFLDDALRHYRLAWRDIIAHGFLQTPAAYYKRARVRGGPWRYSKYDIHLFLITQDGVREVSTELNFEKASTNGQERNNYRFDAVSSVHVAKTDESSCTLKLTLMNGPTRNIRITDPEMRQPDPHENPATFSDINIDAAGFRHTLHILEGIAAEGKNWINRDPHANRNSDGLPPTANGRRTAVSSGHDDDDTSPRSSRVSLSPVDSAT